MRQTTIAETAIAHGMPQKRWPDEHPLYARFGVEVGGAQEALPGRARRFCVEARDVAFNRRAVSARFCGM